MKKCLAAVGLLVCASGAALAGPNAGGTLLAHDADLLMSATNGSVSICSQGLIPSDCGAMDTEIDGSIASDPSVWKVYAAFPEGSAPRLMGITWGVTYDAGIVIPPGQYGMCGSFELNDDTWPASGTGSSVTWPAAQTGLLTPVYWFMGYNDHAPTGQLFHLGPNPSPTMGGLFGDDSVPAVLDSIAGYGSLGFDRPGSTLCPSFGACCHPDGECVMASEAECAPPATWQSGIPCDPSPCPGACCLQNGTCQVLLTEECLQQGGYRLGAGTGCDPNPCVELGACCSPTGTCTITPQSACAPPSLWMGRNTICDPSPCPAPGACCHHDGSCTFVLESGCAAPDTWLGPNTSCDPNPCPQPAGACCLAGGTCQVLTDTVCEEQGGRWLGMDTGCDPNPCPRLGACCYPDGSCAVTFQEQCAAPATWQGEGTNCSPNPCPPPTGACCTVYGSCTVTTQDDCAAPGLWLGPGTNCSPNLCPGMGHGPNAGGTLVLHDCSVGYPPPGSACTAGSTPSACTEIDAELDGASPGSPKLFRVYAAFPSISSPRLMGITWGVHYDGSRLVLSGWGKCADFELNDPTWPATDTGSSVTWDAPQTAHLVPVYYFGGYAYSPTTLHLRGNPDHGGWFGDDSVPSILDPVAGYGSLGFDQAGAPVCPDTEPPGACCHGDGTCTLRYQSACTAPDVWQGPGTSCSPNPCPPPGACCHPDGTCTRIVESQCTAPSAWMGPGTSCSPNPCPQPTGACCISNGTCSVRTQVDCQHLAGTWLGAGTSCSPNPCPQPGACCRTSGACVITLESQCTAPSVWQGPGTSCSPNPCPPAGACCRTDGTCTVIIESHCTAPNVWQGPNTTCTPNPCPQPPGACCFHDGTCEFLTHADCYQAGGTWFGPYGDCDPNPCLLGACCSDTECWITTEPDCAGWWMGIGTLCDPNPCVGGPEEGACCHGGGSCTITTQGDCDGMWLGQGTRCDPNPCGGAPSDGACCHPDGSCTMTLQPDCDGTWMGSDTGCDPNPCDVSGACCFGTTCIILHESQCDATWLGPGTSCLPNPCCARLRDWHPMPDPGGNAVAVGPGPGVVIQGPSPNTICPGAELKRNDDESYENGYAWAYDGVVQPYFGAWAEGFMMSSGASTVCGMRFALTQLGGQDGHLLDAYVWGADDCEPLAVIAVITGVNPGTIGTWPQVTQHDVDISDTAVPQTYYVGWWGAWPGQASGWYVVADENGPGLGTPRTNIAPGIGFPTGWQHPGVVSTFAGCRDLGIASYELGSVVPVERMTWGRIKTLFRDK